LNYLFTENLTLNYAQINLLLTKRLNHNLINNFVKKNKFLPNIYAKKKTLETRNLKVPTNKTRQKKHIYNLNTNSK